MITLFVTVPAALHKFIMLISEQTDNEEVKDIQLTFFY